MTDRPSEQDHGFDPALTRGLLSRRGMLAGIGATGLAGLLAACGTKGTATKANPSAQAAEDRSDTEKVVSWSNWPEYIDVDDKTQAHPTLAAFTKQTGIKVTYTEDYNDNDEFFAKVQPQLRAGADTGRDVWCSTDWMVAKLIRLNWVQKLDKANIPNAKNLQDTLADVEFDPGRQFSLPWQSGFTGIGYNPKATGGKKIETHGAAVHRQGAQGQGHPAHRDARHRRHDPAGDGQGPGEVHRRRLRRRHRAARPTSRTAASSRASPATSTARAWPPATSPHAWPGPATWCSCRPTTRAWATRCPRPAT